MNLHNDTLCRTWHKPYSIECFWYRAVKNGFKTWRHRTLQMVVACLCSQLSLLSELGFGGVLLYVDPCDAPLDRHTWHQTFRVTLNPGGSPALGRSLCQIPFFFLLFWKTNESLFWLRLWFQLLLIHICTLVLMTGTRIDIQIFMVHLNFYL